jgi:hypothetical protein
MLVDGRVPSDLALAATVKLERLRNQKAMEIGRNESRQSE